MTIRFGGLLAGALVANTAAFASDPVVRLDCAAPRAEVAYNGIDDDCDEATPDDDLDGDGVPLHLDCVDDDPNVQAEIVDSELRVDRPMSDLCPDAGPYLIKGDIVLTPLVRGIEGLSCVCGAGGDLVLAENANLSDLSGLESLVAVGGSVRFERATGLSTLKGLGGLVTVGGDFVVVDAPKLGQLDGLAALRQVRGSFVVERADALPSLNGPSSLQRIGTDLRIAENGALVSTLGLDALRYVGGSVTFFDNDGLLKVSGFPETWHVGGDFVVDKDSALVELGGFDALAAINGEVVLSRSKELVSVSGFDRLQVVRGGVSLDRVGGLKDAGKLASFEDGLPTERVDAAGDGTLGGPLGFLRRPEVMLVAGVLFMAGAIGMSWMVFRSSPAPRREAPQPTPAAGAPDLNLSVLPESLQTLPEAALRAALPRLDVFAAPAGSALREGPDPDFPALWVVRGQVDLMHEGTRSAAYTDGALVNAHGLVAGVAEPGALVVAVPADLCTLDREGYEALAAAGSPVAQIVQRAAIDAAGALVDQRAEALYGRLTALPGSPLSGRVALTRSHSRIDALLGAPMETVRLALADVAGQTTILSGLSAASVGALLAVAELQTIERQAQLMVEGERVDVAFLVLSGEVALVGWSVRGSAERLEIAGPGSFVGFAEVATGRAATRTAIVRSTSALLLVFQSSDLAEIMQRDDATGGAARTAVTRLLTELGNSLSNRIAVLGRS
jgi:CRP-like cAMP-binding protein